MSGRKRNASASSKAILTRKKRNTAPIPDFKVPNRVIVLNQRPNKFSNLLPSNVLISSRGIVSQTKESVGNILAPPKESKSQKKAENKSANMSEEGKFRHKIVMGFTNLLKSTRSRLPEITRNRYFRHNHKNWGKYCNPVEVDGDERKKLANAWYDDLGWTPEYLRKMILNSSVPFKIPLMKLSESFDLYHALHWQNDKSWADFDHNVPVKWLDDPTHKRFSKPCAESFSKKVLAKICINQQEFRRKDHSTKKQALEDAGMKTGYRFWDRFRTVLFLCAVDPSAVSKVANKFDGPFADNPSSAGEAFLKEAKKIYKKKGAQYPGAIDILKEVFPTVEF